MKAAVIYGYGKKQKLHIIDVAYPKLGDNDVLIEIHAASINPVDFKTRDGKLRFLRPYQFPLILGHDLAGRIVEIGKNVTRFKIGDEVYCRPRAGRIGTFTEFIAADEADVALKPRNLSMVEAAGIPLVGLTSWQALIDIGKIGPGSRVFIPAGAGGVGTFAIQLAKTRGAHVSTTCSSKNESLVRSLGADEVIDYHKQDFASILENQDMVFDTIGGESLVKSFAIVKPGGLIVSISGMPDRSLAKEMHLGPFKTLLLSLAGLQVTKLAKRHAVHYRFLFMRASGAELAQISSLIETGEIRPLVDQVYDLERIEEAIVHSESGHARGKIIVRIKPAK